MNRTQEVAAIKRLTKTIEQGEAAVEDAKWERAERLAVLSDDGMTQVEIASLTGLSQGVISTAIRISRQYSARNIRYADADYELKGRGPGFGNSANKLPEKLTYTEKVELVRKLVADPVVRAAVEPQMSAPLPAVRHEAPSLTEAWESWLSRLNTLLTDGAKLADRGDDDRLSAYAASARMFYERITERQLDAEIRAFFEEVEA